MLTRARLKSIEAMSATEDFTKSLLLALENFDVGERFRLILQPSIQELLQPMTSVLEKAVQDLQPTVSTLKNTVTKKDAEILALRQEVRDLRATADDMEQHSRRASIRVFGVPEDTPGSTDDKFLVLFNGVMKVQPPIQLNEIEVSHRVGRLETVQGESGEAPVVKPRAIIAKFVSRRTKVWVMSARKELRRTGQRSAVDRRSGGAPRPASHISTDEEPHNDDATSETTPEDARQDPLSNFPLPVYISDDLSRIRAKLAYQARLLKRNECIQDTWVVGSKIMVKDKNNRISKVNRPEDLHKFQ